MSTQRSTTLYFLSHDFLNVVAGIPLLLPFGSGGAEDSPCMEAGGAQGNQPDSGI